MTTPNQSIMSILENVSNWNYLHVNKRQSVDEAHAQILAVFKEIIPFMVYEDGTPRKGDYVAGFNDARQLLLNSIGEMGKL